MKQISEVLNGWLDHFFFSAVGIFKPLYLFSLGIILKAKRGFVIYLFWKALGCLSYAKAL